MANYCKYYKQQRQVSHDSGITWENMDEYRKGDLYEDKSPDCGYQRIERWVTTGTSCIGYDKYNDQVKEISEDGGNTWRRTSETQQALYQRNSYDCGYGVKVKATLKDSTVETISCEQHLIADPNRVTSADTSGFVSDITDLVIYDCAEIIDSGAFKGATALTSVTVATAVTTTRIQSFQGCTSLRNIELPNVTEVGQACFSGDTSLSGVSIPNAVSIGVGCFMSCTSLQEIELPSTVESIGMYTFDFCSNLKTLRVNAINPPILQHEILLNTHQDLKIYVPCQSIDAYKSANIWSNYADKIVCDEIPQTQYRWVEVEEWCQAPNLWARQKKQISNDYGETWQDVVPEETQDVVKEYASSQCDGGGEYKITTNGKQNRPMVIYCSSATNPGRVTSGDVLGYEYNMDRVTEVNIGSCATELATSSFRGCGISAITVPSNVIELHPSAFAYSSLVTIEFKSSTPPTVPENDGTIFAGCSHLESIIVPCGSLSAYKTAFNTWQNKVVEKSPCN